MSDVKLLPCPFCKDPMQNHVGIIRHVDQGRCPIGAYAWPVEDAERWNARACVEAALSAQPRQDATFAEWLATEMPAGTVIGDPAWWANRIARQYAVRSAQPASAPVGVEGEVAVRESVLRYCIRELNGARQGDNAEGRAELAHAALTAALTQQPRQDEVARDAAIDWRAMYRFQTAMRYMDNNAAMTRDRAYQLADREIKAMEATGGES